MKPSKIMCDKTEMVVIDESSSRRVMMRIRYDQLINIAFDPCTERGFMKEIPSEKISLNVKMKEEPLVYYKAKDKDNWEQYKTELRKFCKDNRVSLYDNLPKEEGAE